MSADPALRLYPTGTGAGVGRRGRAETFIEARLDLLAATQTGYLWLLFSADALRDGGTVEQILAHSKDYAADLGRRLRERIHTNVIPDLAMGIMTARRIRSPSVNDLTTTYQMALTLLFRLLFVAYAEDKGLLPSGSVRRARYPPKLRSIRSTAATRKWPEPIAMSATRKSKKPSPAARSSRASSRARWSTSACSSAWSSRCFTANCLVKNVPVVLRVPEAV